MDDDRFYHATSTGDLYYSSIRRQYENQENAFAAWLLVPGEKLIEDIKNFAGNPDWAFLADRYQVSAAVLKVSARKMVICHSAIRQDLIRPGTRPFVAD